MSIDEASKKWIDSHKDGTVEDAFKAGWFCCTDEWCHHKREEMERVCELMIGILH